MRTNFRIILLKFIVCIIIFTVAFDLFFEAGVTEVLSFSILVTIVSYFIGDKIILPRVGNRAAVIIDFFTVYGIVWIFGNILLHSYEQIAWGSIIAATLIGISEVFVHLFLLGRFEAPTTTERKRPLRTSQKLAFGTEFAEESDPRKKN
ncbi:YndM family protein [Robertmurraya korlensis]|uniref:YndM family protein n=1 Tax=Robertmurraya korlensis TaxID=519977 RepID=UPI00203D9F20|nr:YndM family protein [Robertmurraya korlensis]MCM3601507.1 YndM family protein [Robertmurraya korlensis]